MQKSAATSNRAHFGLTRGGLREFETVMQTTDVLEDLHRSSYVNTEKVFYCSYKMILNTTSQAGESSLISSGFKINA